jgi:hypothetical protein
LVSSYSNIRFSTWHYPCFDALGFRHLRSFASSIPKTRRKHQGDEAAEAAERDRQKVKQIIVGTGSGSTRLNVLPAAIMLPL